MKLKFVFTHPDVRSTQCRTKSDLNACKKLCWSAKEARGIENIPVDEFDLLLTIRSGKLASKMKATTNRLH